MIRGHNSAQSLWLYFRPTRRCTTLEPATARIAWSLLERSADKTSAPGTEAGFRPTTLKGFFLAARSLTISLLIPPPAPRIVIMSAVPFPITTFSDSGLPSFNRVAFLGYNPGGV